MMTDNVASLEDFLAKRKAIQDAATQTPPTPLLGCVVYSDGSWRITEQVKTGENFVNVFKGLAEVCETVRKLYEARKK